MHGTIPVAGVYKSFWSRSFFDAMRVERIDVRRLAGIKIAAIGEGTRRKVEDKGIFINLLP